MAAGKEVKAAAVNRKARYNYTIEDSLEAGLVLTGSEVKSLREGRANIAESYASEEAGEIWLINCYIPEYDKAGIRNHESRRPRKLLLHRKQIERLGSSVHRQGMTLVPLKLYFNTRGVAKLQLGLAKGKRQYEKRETEKKRDWEREKGRIIREKG